MVCSYQRAACLAYPYHRTMAPPDGEPNVPTLQARTRTAGERPDGGRAMRDGRE
jgi:hypothetical protein